MVVATSSFVVGRRLYPCALLISRHATRPPPLAVAWVWFRFLDETRLLVWATFRHLHQKASQKEEPSGNVSQEDRRLVSAAAAAAIAERHAVSCSDAD
jgi:hypothetical protein